ncbi:MAG: radical SAM protein [Desulfuromonadales bacterium]|nr:radical SAM protein [Desulfuromonadales bacterium]
MGRALRLLINDKCNFNCHFCHNEFQGYTNRTSKQKFNIRKVCFLYETLNSLHQVDIVKFSGGEPLLEINQVTGISKVLLEKYSVKPILLSNLRLITEESLLELKVSGIGEIRVNMPSFTASTYTLHVGGNKHDYDAVVANMLKIAKHKIPISLNVVVSNLKQIHGSIEGFIYCASKFVDPYRISFIVNDRLPNKNSINIHLLQELRRLSTAPIIKKRGRIYQGLILNKIITVTSCVEWSLLTCNTQDESDFYCIPPGILLTSMLHGRANQ